MEVFMGLTSDNVISSFLDIVHYASQYFNTSNINPIYFWSIILQLREEKGSWKAVLLLVELNLCAPFLNASLDWLLSHMNIIKTTI